MGAFFVRRDSRNALYRRVLECYISMATKEGVCQAMFPEGGLSKDGKLRPPKLGLLDYMLRNFDHENDRDILFIPVGINYDRTLEDRTLLRSLDPEATHQGNWFAIKTTMKFWLNNIQLKWRHRLKNFGFAAVNFGTPISVAEFSKKTDINFSSLEKQQRFIHVQEFSNKLFGAVGEVVPVLPLSAICRVLQLNPAQSFNLQQLKANAALLIDQCSKKGAVDFINKVQLDDAFNEALEMLIIRHLIDEDDGTLKIAPQQQQIIEYYANSIAHWF